MHARPILQSLESTRVEREQLLARIHRAGYRTLVDHVTVGPLKLSFTRIEDPNRVLDEVAAREDLRERLAEKRTPGDALGLPYWAELWDSSQGVGQYLTQVLNGGRAARVMDLGCGMGFTGMVSAALGAEVLMVDLERPALLFARLNGLQYSKSVRARQMNWRVDRLEEKFDLIIGADILYEKTQWVYQEPFWRHHLTREGTVLLAEPGRQTGDLFLNWIKGKGWELERFAEIVPTRAQPIRLMRLRMV
ncbi:MAG TPA: methyltransferase [Tepidisphaeraceae bacterium]|nr:methyltransferase [Tepidisphaeraceae bacterium]